MGNVLVPPFTILLVSYQDYTLHATPHLYEVQKYLSQLQIALILFISHISSCSYQAVQMIEYSSKAQTQSQEEVIQLMQLILPHGISITVQ